MFDDFDLLVNDFMTTVNDVIYWCEYNKYIIREGSED